MRKKHQKMTFAQRKQRFSLTLLLTLVVFLILLFAVAIAALAVYLMVRFGAFGIETEAINIGHIIAVMALSSLVIGSALTVILGKFPVRPIYKLINGMNSLAAGDFKTRIEYEGPIGSHKTFKGISESFNTLACELENTEVLRRDFINNFSHEFKTPIVSIAGFTGLLKNEGISEEERLQYLNAIEEESRRLAYMATNVLNLTKIENQSILTDITEFNVSEQIRSAVLLLEGKWSAKDIELKLELDEYVIEANEELLKEVWINLVDNAVKFVSAGGYVSICTDETEDAVKVTVSNTCEDIPKEKLKRIFNKFYQADESHAGEGNGIGLAIVKKIVDLHGGKVCAKSENGTVEFTVELPKKR